MKLPKFITDLLTGPDGTTFDVVRVAFAGAFLTYVGYAGYDVIFQHIHFDLVRFGEGFAALTAATGGSVAIKQWAGAEPPHKKDAAE